MVQVRNDKRFTKPQKPRADFPLFPHQNGQWAKKIRGRLHYFGPWDDWRAALNDYLDKKEDLQAGRTPVTTPDAKRFDELVEAFLGSKQALADSGERSDRTPEDYQTIFDKVREVWGNIALEQIGKSEFATLREELAEIHSPITLANDIQRVRCLFNWAYENDFLDRPMKYGDSFKKPSKKAQRRQRNNRPKKFFPAPQIQLMLEEATPTLRAMIYLGINCGFGNDDCATLTYSALKNGWHNHPRPKTEIQRRCSLWKETLAAIKDVRRPEPNDPELQDRVFITSKGNSWESCRTDKPITKETAKMLKKLGMKRWGVNFYALRHTFQTIGEEVDLIATRYIMGHVDESISARYREKVRDHRLRAVTDHVYSWLHDGQATCQVPRV